MWQKVVLIPRGKGDFWGIGIVKVLWTAVESLINRQLATETTHHYALHGFWAGQVMGTTALKAMLIQ